MESFLRDYGSIIDETSMNKEENHKKDLNDIVFDDKHYDIKSLKYIPKRCKVSKREREGKLIIELNQDYTN